MKKTISELSPEEQEQQRARWRDAQNKTRAAKKAPVIPTADELADEFFGSLQYFEIRQYAERQHKQIAEELGVDHRAWFHHPAYYDIDYVLWTLHGFKNALIRQVSEPNGIRVAGFIYADVIGRRIVSATHRHGLERSPKFSALYRELLQILDQRFGKHLSDDPIERKAALDVKAELNGTYVLPEQPRTN